MKKRFIRFFVGLTIVLLIFGLLGCISTPKLEDYERISFSEFQKIFKDVATTEKRPKQGLGFIVEGYFITSKGTYYFIDTPNNNGGMLVNFYGYTNREKLLNLYGDDDCKKYHSHRQVANYELDYLLGHIDSRKKLIVYIGFYHHSQHNKWEACIDKIEGLRTREEVEAIEAKQRIEAREAKQKEEEAKQKAEEQAKQKEEAKRKAEEQANKYDPSKFTVVPSNFKPAKYTPIDLFDAVAGNKKYTRLSEAEELIDYVTEFYKSDVVFVNQYGTEITFRTSDNIVSNSFQINTRSGLSSGQRVRIYYRKKLENIFGYSWTIDAIERL